MRPHRHTQAQLTWFRRLANPWTLLRPRVLARIGVLTQRGVDVNSQFTYPDVPAPRLFAAAAVLVAIAEGVVRFRTVGSIRVDEPERLDKLRTAAFSHTATDGQMLRYMATVLRELEVGSAVGTQHPHLRDAQHSAAPKAQVRPQTVLQNILAKTTV